MKTYTLHRFGLFSLLKFGFVTGLIAAFPVVGLLIIAIWRTAINLLDWLENYEIVIPLQLLLVDDISISAIETLRGWPPLDYLQTIAAQNWLQVMFYIFLVTFLAGVWTALVGFFSGLAFNALSWLSGGLKISLSNGTDSLQPEPRQPSYSAKAISGSHQPVPDPPTSAAALGPRSLGPYLEVQSPIQKILPITAAEILIGSSPECAIALDDLLPRHAKLSYEGGRYILRDLSQGKTMVQGHVVEGLNMVKDGFKIQLGPYHMVFRYGA